MQLMPRSLFGRLVVVMTLGLIIAQLISVALHLMERQRSIARTVSEEITERIVSLYQALDSVDGNERLRLASLLSSKSLSVELEAGGAPAPIEHQEDIHFLRTLKAALGSGVIVDAQSAPQLGVTQIDLRLQLTDRNWLHIRGGAPREMFAWPTHLFVNLGAMIFSLAGLSWVVVRSVTKPLGSLARAAHELGQDINKPPLPETGPLEVAEAAKEFNSMQHRLKQSIEERARFLAAVSHDLKTPITRMRLRVEMLEESPLREKFDADLNEMEAMVRAALDYLRGEIVDEPLRPVDLTALVETVVEDFMEAGARLELHCNAEIRSVVRPHALRRCLTNLIDNALKYGGEEVAVAVEEWPDGVCILVRDRGPGVPADELENVFEPFYRVENSRSRETGGTGLGLAIARQVALSHGGNLRLTNRDGGGLEARLQLAKPTSTLFSRLRTV